MLKFEPQSGRKTLRRCIQWVFGCEVGCGRQSSAIRATRVVISPVYSVRSYKVHETCMSKLCSTAGLPRTKETRFTIVKLISIKHALRTACIIIPSHALGESTPASISRMVHVPSTCTFAIPVDCHHVAGIIFSKYRTIYGNDSFVRILLSIDINELSLEPSPTLRTIMKSVG